MCLIINQLFIAEEILSCHRRFIEIDRQFVPRTGRRGLAKRIKRDSMSFIIRLKWHCSENSQYIALIVPDPRTISTLARVIIPYVPSIYISL